MLAAGTVAAVLFGLPAAGASGAPRPATTGASPAQLCARVSAGAVSKVVGHPVPAPSAARAKSMFDKAKNIEGLLTQCTYGPAATEAQVKKAVEIDYATLSKPVSVSIVRQQLQSEVASDAKVKVSDYGGLSVPAVYVVAAESGGTVEAMAAVKGTKLVIAGLGTAAPEAEVAAVTRLGVRAFM